MNANSTEDSGEAPLIYINLDFGDGRQDRIAVYAEDEPAQVARNFCQRHALDSTVEAALRREVASELSKLSKSPLQPAPQRTPKPGRSGGVSHQQLRSQQALTCKASHIQATKVGQTNKASHIQAGKGSHVQQRRETSSLQPTRSSSACPLKKPPLSPRKQPRPPRTQAIVFPFAPDLSATNKTNRRMLRNKSLESTDVVLGVPPKLLATEQPKTNLVARMRQNRFQALFKQLNPVNGQINKRTVKHLTLDPTTLKLIQPLLRELIELDEQLTESEFCRCMGLLVASLNPHEKNQLFSVRPSSAFRRPVLQSKRL